MERLTERSGSGKAVYRHPTPEPEGWEANRAAVLDKCCRYEDTGLEPKDVTTAKSLAIQYLKETIEANEKSIQLGRKDGADVTCICEANKNLEKVLLKLAAGYQVNPDLEKEQ